MGVACALPCPLIPRAQRAWIVCSIALKAFVYLIVSCGVLPPFDSTALMGIHGSGWMGRRGVAAPWSKRRASPAHEASP